MPVLSTVQRRNLVVICGGLTGIMATSWYFLHWSQQKEHDLEAERLARPHPYRYRLPLHVPAGPEFSLDDLNETYCMEFFR